MNNIDYKSMPIVKAFRLPLTLLKLIYKYLVPSRLLSNLISLPLYLLNMRVVIGTSQTGSDWCDNYMLAYNISYGETFTCYSHSFVTILRVNY